MLKKSIALFLGVFVFFTQISATASAQVFNDPDAAIMSFRPLTDMYPSSEVAKHLDSNSKIVGLNQTGSSQERYFANSPQPGAYESSVLDTFYNISYEKGFLEDPCATTVDCPLDVPMRPSVRYDANATNTKVLTHGYRDGHSGTTTINYVKQTLEKNLFPLLRESNRTTKVTKTGASTVQISSGVNVNEDEYKLTFVRYGSVLRVESGDRTRDMKQCRRDGSGHCDFGQQIDDAVYYNGNTYFILWETEWAWSKEKFAMTEKQFKHPIDENRSPIRTKLPARQSNSKSEVKTRPLNSDIVFMTVPMCYSSEWNTLIKTKAKVDCTTYALAANGKVGKAEYHEEKSVIGGYLSVIALPLAFINPLVFPAILPPLASIGMNVASTAVSAALSSLSIEQAKSAPALGTIENPPQGVGTWTWSGGFSSGIAPATSGDGGLFGNASANPVQSRVVTALPSCSISFSPASISAGNQVIAQWSSSQDEDGAIEAVCTNRLVAFARGNISENGQTSISYDAISGKLPARCNITVKNKFGARICSATLSQGTSPVINNSSGQNTSSQSGGVCTPPASGCGGTDQWSCVSGQCRAPVCGDGVCNDCSLAFSPCMPKESYSSCPQDCKTSPSLNPGGSSSGQGFNSGDSNIPLLQTGEKRNSNGGWRNNLYTMGWKGEANGTRYFKIPVPCDGKKHQMTLPSITDLWSGLFADILVKRNSVPSDGDMDYAMKNATSSRNDQRHVKLADGKDGWYANTFSGGSIYMPSWLAVRAGSEEENTLKSKGAILYESRKADIANGSYYDLNFYYTEPLLQCGEILYVMVRNRVATPSSSVHEFTNKLDLSYGDYPTSFAADSAKPSISGGGSVNVPQFTPTNDISVLRKQVQELMKILTELIARLTKIRQN